MPTRSKRINLTPRIILTGRKILKKSRQIQMKFWKNINRRSWKS